MSRSFFTATTISAAYPFPCFRITALETWPDSVLPVNSSANRNTGCCMLPSSNVIYIQNRRAVIVCGSSDGFCSVTVIFFLLLSADSFPPASAFAARGGRQNRSSMPASSVYIHFFMSVFPVSCMKDIFRFLNPEFYFLPA